jgi:hypothetical protein
VRLAAGHFPDDFEHAACEPIDGAFGLIASSTLEHVLSRLFTGAPGVGTVGDSSARWPTSVAATRTRG